LTNPTLELAAWLAAGPSAAGQSQYRRAPAGVDDPIGDPAALLTVDGAEAKGSNSGAGI
jgi:hypothetical protein